MMLGCSIVILFQCFPIGVLIPTMNRDNHSHSKAITRGESPPYRMVNLGSNSICSRNVVSHPNAQSQFLFFMYPLDARLGSAHRAPTLHMMLLNQFVNIRIGDVPRN